MRLSKHLETREQEIAALIVLCILFPIALICYVFDRIIPKIRFFESCVGLSLPHFGKYKVEFWYAPAGYSIKPHTHPNEDIKLILLFGHDVRFHRRKQEDFLGESFLAKFTNAFKVFTINATDEHWFEVSDWPLIFVNFEKWKTEPSSACDDLKLTER
jgi:hypothetical protein